jgi:hypothetical protein
MLPKSGASVAVSVEGISCRPARGVREVTLMLFVPVVGSEGKPLMPCRPERARELVRSGRAVRRFDRGLFYIRLKDRADGAVQPAAVGIDPGSKKEAFTVKSEAHTYLNIQTDAVTWVSKRMDVRRDMCRGRRGRNTPYRECRPNRKQGSAEGRLPPSTRSRWGWKLRICVWLSKYYPITVFTVEDVKARTRKGQRQWNRSFSPLEAGKGWFYGKLEKLARVEKYGGYDTKALRDALGLKKTKDKMSGRFDAHCVDSWILANAEVGGHSKPDNTRIMYVVPLRFHRRQLHYLQPKKGGIRPRYGGTMSLGLKRGTWVRHPRYGVTYVGGCGNGRISLHCLRDGRRLSQDAKPSDCAVLTRCSWRAYAEKSEGGGDSFRRSRPTVPSPCNL